MHQLQLNCLKPFILKDIAHPFPPSSISFPQREFTLLVQKQIGEYTYKHIYTYICIYAFFHPIFSAVLLDLLNDTAAQHRNPPRLLHQQAVPRHHCPDTHSSSHLYCNAALQKGSSKHALTKRNKWLIRDGWITKTCTKKDAVTRVAFRERVLPDQKIGQQFPSVPLVHCFSLS